MYYLLERGRLGNFFEDPATLEHVLPIMDRPEKDLSLAAKKLIGEMSKLLPIRNVLLKNEEVMSYFTNTCREFAKVFILWIKVNRFGSIKHW
jgi:hypothetical protein